MAFWPPVDCLSIHCGGNSPSEGISLLWRDPGIFQGVVFRKLSSLSLFFFSLKLSSLKKKKIWSWVWEGACFQNGWLQEPPLDHCGGSRGGFACLVHELMEGSRVGWSLREFTAHLLFPVEASVLFLPGRLEVCVMFQWVMAEKPTSQPAVYETS